MDDKLGTQGVTPIGPQRIAVWLIKLALILFLSLGLVHNFAAIEHRSLLVDPLLMGAGAIAIASLLLFRGVRHNAALGPDYWRSLKGFAVFALCLAALVLVSSNPWMERLLGAKNHLLYPSLALLVPIVMTRRDDLSAVLALLRISMLLLCAFGIAQASLGYALPRALLVIDGINILPFAERPDIVRANGLIGNALEFSGFAVFAYVLWLAQALLIDRKRASLLAAAICLCAILATYSRMAVVTAMGCTAVVIAASGQSWQQIARRFVVAVVTIGLVAAVAMQFKADVFLISRFFAMDVNTIESNRMHAQDLAAVLRALQSHPIIGVGIGTQGVSAFSDSAGKIITDGHIFILLVEGGLLLGLAYLGFVGSIAYALLRHLAVDDASTRAMVVVALLGLGALHFMGLTNSALSAPINCAFLYTYIGAAFVAMRLHRVSSPTEPATTGTHKAARVMGFHV